MTLLDTIKHLPLEDKAAILFELQEDEELNEFLLKDSLPQAAMEELKRRDKAYKEGNEPTYTWEAVQTRLQAIKDAL